MVCKLPSTRSLSKASREGDLRENMATADISASGKAISVSSVRASGMLAKPFRTKRKSASAERCLRPLGATIDIAPPHVKAVHRVSVRGILSHGGLRKDNPDIKVITGFYRSPGIAVDSSLISIDAFCQPTRVYAAILTRSPKNSSLPSSFGTPLTHSYA